MSKIYNTIGSLITIQNHLVNNNLDEFHTLTELINFQNNYPTFKQQIILNHTQQIEEEQKILEIDIPNLTATILRNKTKVKEELNQQLEKLDKQIYSLPVSNSKIIPILMDYYKNLVIWIKICLTHLKFQYKILLLEKKFKKLLSEKQNRNQYLLTNFQDAVTESCQLELESLLRKKEIIGEINNTIYGAFGEQKVVEELKSLSDDYILINDFTYSFEPAIYHQQENAYIKTIQIDHLLISPSGVFIIETKNWSKDSIANLDFRSPVQQVRRTSYALFKMLNNAQFSFKNHHWGNRKIPLKNLIVLINHRPTGEFQFVKILTLSELLKYIKFFTPSFTTDETKKIAEYFLTISKQNTPISKLSI